MVSDLALGPGPGIIPGSRDRDKKKDSGFFMPSLSGEFDIRNASRNGQLEPVRLAPPKPKEVELLVGTRMAGSKGI